jgi:hypothetical protein
MKKMTVTMTVQTQMNFDPTDEEIYQEELNHLVMELEDLGLTVSVESEETTDDDDEESLEEDY